MTIEAPTTELGSTGSSAGVSAMPWSEGEKYLRNAGVYWLSTVRPEGGPHVTPLIAVWTDGALYFCAGLPDRKVKHLEKNRQVVIATGCNELQDALDIVVEGDAVVVTDGAKLQQVADIFAAKYGEGWRLPSFEGVSLFEVRPTQAFGFGRGDAKAPPPHGGFSQTRWRF